MESNGARNRIHCSKETVALLEQAGKEWAKPREDLVHAKGKGEMQTYWIETSKTSNPSGSVSTDDRSIDTTESWIDSAGRVSNVQNGIQCKIYREKMQRLVDWNTDVFCRLLKQVVGRQQSSPSEKKSNAMLTDDFTLKSTAAVIDEVVETIELPQVVNNAKELLDVELSEKVVGQVHHYVQTIASMYRDNPFHNFEHVSSSDQCIFLASYIGLTVVSALRRPRMLQ